MVLDANLLNIQHHKVRIKGKWSNIGTAVAPSPTPRYSSYWKGSLQVTLDNSRPTYIYIYIYIYIQREWDRGRERERERERERDNSLYTSSIYQIVFNLSIYGSHFIQFFHIRNYSHGTMVKAINCGMVGSDFDLQSRYDAHFPKNTGWKRYKPLIHPVMGQIVPLLFF